MKILDISPVGVYPPNAGGHLRIHNLNLQLSKYHKIFLFSQNIRKFELKFPIRSWITKINDNYIEYRYINIPTLLTSYIFSRWKIPNLLLDEILRLYNPKILRNKVSDCDIIQIELPWQFKYLYDIKPKDKPIILNGQNVEYDLIKQITQGFLASRIIKTVWEKEKFAVENANVVFMVSEEDKNRVHKLYDVPKSKIYIIPNGVNIDKQIVTNEEKIKLKERYGFKNKKIILFVGGTHLPNIKAVDEIIKISKSISIRDEHILFLVVGRCGERFKKGKYRNIMFTGLVDNVKDYFKMADIAINPVLSGSGTNTKMLEYMAFKLPIITTTIGARGLDIENRKHAIVCNVEEFPYWIETLLNDEDLRIKLGTNARKLVEEKYDWKVIAERVNKIYRKLVK